MGGFTKHVLIAVAVAILATGLWQQDRITRLFAVTSLFDADRITQNFSHMDAAFLSVTLPAGNDPSTLPKGAPFALPDAVQDYVTDRSVTALVILQNGQIRFEDDDPGTAPTDLRINWSVSKSWLSALFGVLHGDGTIPDHDAPVTLYAPALAGSAYDGVPIRAVLRMSSGVTFDEDDLSFFSDINRMGRVLGLGGLNVRARDNARFGAMIARDGLWQGQQIVPRDWIIASTSASAPTDAGQTGYGCQWWIPVGSTPDQVMARGIYGQYIWIDRARDIVIVVHAADREFTAPGVVALNKDIFRLIADAL